MDENVIPLKQLTSKEPSFERLQNLREFYKKQFAAEPKFFVRVPGRVNIIGEHVDYCGYPVLPMALEQCILLAVGFAEAEIPTLKLHNMDSTKFESFECSLMEDDVKIELPAEGSGPAWYNYFLCGFKGVQDAFLEGEAEKTNQNWCVRVALSGNIPPAAGLSSSSALVSAATIAFALLYGMKLRRDHLAEVAARCERYIGTQGGGMDQAIAFLAKAGYAQFIEFQPKLKATPVQLPDGACFVVANSLAEINKAATSDFNERVVECQLGARLIAKACGLSNWREVTRFWQLQNLMNCTLEHMIQMILQNLPSDIYKRDQLCSELGISDAKLELEFLTPNTQHMQVFKLRQRALHVIQESLRVQEFRAICEKSNVCSKQVTSNSNGNGNTAAEDNFKKLSKLIRASHQSLKLDYECSHPFVDRLIALSDEMNVSARITGAGWGGCIVALCDSKHSAELYMEHLRVNYYSKLPFENTKRHLENGYQESLFATTPCDGAELFHL